MKTNLIGMLSIFILLLGCVTSPRQQYGELATVNFVDPNLYMGKWYEVASFPQSFQKDCVCTMATYTLRSDGDIDVLNECRLRDFSGPLKSALGKAKIIDTMTNSKLEVSFFWPFYGKYWIIDLGKNYEYAVVGHPNRDYLWILSRTKKMDAELLHNILERIKNMQFDVTRLKMTPQPD